jgi:hypothetical protein
MASLARGIKPQAYRSLVEAALKQGWTISATGSQHIRLEPPGGGSPVWAAKTLSDHRGIKNFRATLRRRGVIC